MRHELLNKVSQLREQRKISQKALGEALRHPVSRQTINAIENGRYEPKTRLLLDLAAYFQTPAEEIFYYADESAGNPDQRQYAPGAP